MKKHVKEFLDFLGVNAIKHLIDEGFDPAIVISQSALETGWGKSLQARVAKNLFGIKGTGQTWTTQEFIDGKWVTIQASFKRYSSVLDCIKDYVSIIKRVYPKAYQNRNNPVVYIQEVAKKWATDPNYAEKVLAIYKSIERDVKKWISENLSKS